MMTQTFSQIKFTSTVRLTILNMINANRGIVWAEWKSVVPSKVKLYMEVSPKWVKSNRCREREERKREEERKSVITMVSL